jgi:heavy metal translocating P-type ATPase
MTQFEEPTTAEFDQQLADATKPHNDAGQAASAPGRRWRILWSRRQLIIASIALAGITLHLVLRFAVHAAEPWTRLPLLFVLALGGIPLILELAVKLHRRQFGSDLLAGISIITSALLNEYLAGSLVVLMLSGGEALEAYAVRSASSVLRALANRMPSIAHRKVAGRVADVPLSQVAIGETLLVFPHEICPVDGLVVEGHGTMDESYLTGEPFQMSKVPGSDVFSGAINGEGALTIRTTKLAIDSRYAKIMQVMRASEQDSPRLRRLGDQLGAYYTPLTVGIALLAWAVSGHANRFLAVLVVATPCPLLIAIPVAIIGSISLAARRGIIIKKPAVLEQVDTCRTIIFDKTGTLTYGQPMLADILPAPGFDKLAILRLTASLERYSKHPLARAVLAAAADATLILQAAKEISERPGQGLRGTVAGKEIQITSRKKLLAQQPDAQHLLPPPGGGLECVVLINGVYAATLRFRDEPRAEGASFVHHLGPRHQFDRLMLVSGDRESEVKYLADCVGITEIHAGKTPEEKLAIVRSEVQRAKVLYLGDGINDTPALLASTVGIALGQASDITTEAAGAVIMDSSLQKVDEFFHIGRRMRTVAIQSAVGGMALSAIGMLLAAAGYLPPVAGAVSQEIIDVLAVLNALRAALPPKSLTDF